MKLADFIVKDAIVPELKATDRDGVIRELVSALAAAKAIAASDVDPIVKAILLVPALKTENNLTNGMLGDTYERTLADLSRQEAEQLPWLDPTKIPESTRKSLTQIMADMPAADAGACVGTDDSGTGHGAKRAISITSTRCPSSTAWARAV